MNDEKQLTPQQELDKLLSSAAVDIARMEQVRDSPGRPGSPAPAPKPPGTPPNTNAGSRLPANKDFLNNAIAEKKADTLKKADGISNKVSPEVKKEMQEKTYNTLYPKDKNDLNQIPTNKHARDENNNRMPDKEVDNAQERANALKGKSADKEKGKDTDKGDKEISKSQDRMEGLKEDNKAKIAAQAKDTKPEKQQAKNSMSQQFKQPLVQGKNVQNQSKGKAQSMGTRFSQSLSHNQSSPSSPGRSSPSKSSPGGGGSRGGNGGGGKTKD